MRIAAAVAAMVMTSVAASAQTFDVASVKRQVEVVSGMTFAARGSTLTVINNELTNVIDNAYGIRRYQLIGGPDWINSDRYNIQAKAGGDVPRSEVMLRLRSLLEDRFKLR